MKRVAWLVGGAFLLAGLCSATTVVRATLEELTQKSTLIVRGRVSGSVAAIRGTMIYTVVKIQVLEQLKGPSASTCEVTIPGGIAGGRRQSIAGAPALTEGSEYFFFIWTGKDGVNRVLGMSQGVFSLVRDGGGQVTAQRAAVDATMVDRDTQVQVRDEAVSMSLNEFRSRVRRAAVEK